MVLTDLILAFVVAVVMTYIFVGILGFRGPWPGFIAFLAVLFLATWAGGIWIRPPGPYTYGLYWAAPFVITALVVALLLAAAGPPRRGKVETIHEVKEREHAAVLAINYIVWAAIAILAALIVAEYLVRGP